MASEALLQPPQHRPDDASSSFATVLDRLLDHAQLGEADAERLMDQVLAGALGPERLAALVTALRARPVQSDILAGMARSVRAHSKPVPRPPGLLLDTCGTGTARRKAFNASTATAFVVAACGVPVAKHGNRSVTRPSGSTDLIEAAGGRLDLDPDRAGDLLAKLGVVVLHAPTFHPALQHTVAVRRALGVRTVFNLLGPLCNPARPSHQIVGVAEPGLLRPMAEAIARLGTQEAIVLHGEPGFDDASPAGMVHTLHVQNGRVGRPIPVNPALLGLAAADPSDLAPVAKAEAPDLAREVLAGRGGARSDMVALNAAFALQLAGRSPDLERGLSDARTAMTSGKASALFERYLAATRGE
ncbi:MAG: anthranilate phosphoribosyltransferase [Candidatus Thermoplasmatota archaeon]